MTSTPTIQDTLTGLARSAMDATIYAEIHAHIGRTYLEVADLGIDLQNAVLRHSEMLAEGTSYLLSERFLAGEYFKSAEGWVETIRETLAEIVDREALIIGLNRDLLNV